MAPRPNQQELLSARRPEAQDKSQPTQTVGVFEERHYTVAEVAAMWNLSKDAAHRLFQNEPGVLILPNRARGSKRRYRTIRIPQSIADRVHKHLSLVK